MAKVMVVVASVVSGIMSYILLLKALKAA